MPCSKARIKISPSFSEADVEKLSSALDGFSVAMSAFREDNRDDGAWILEWIFEDSPPEAEILSGNVNLLAAVHEFDIDINSKDWFFEIVPDIDWLSHSYKQFPAFSVGPFFIHGSHYEDKIPDEQIALQIDAATAFGSGEHETTKGCLMAMLDLKGLGVCPWNVLDMGTGSGILAIAAWKLWKTPILAVDHDEEAVRVTLRHMESNGVKHAPSNITCKKADGFRASIVREKGPYELIIANILAGPLIEMSIDVEPLIDSNGYLILSGILATQGNDVLSSYEALGLKLRKSYPMSEWISFLMQKR